MPLTMLHFGSFPLFSVFYSTMRLRPRSSLFPYTTLFRSEERRGRFPAGENRAQNHQREKCKDEALRDVAQYGQRLLRSESTRLNSSHQIISYAVFCLKKKKNINYK